MKKKSTLFWLMRRIRRRIPALIMLLISHVGQALLSVAFALTSRQVIDCAMSGDQGAFLQACLIQGATILGILLCMTVYRHLKERIHADLERDWKRDLLHGLLHGDYVQVSAYHSGELVNRLSNDVRLVSEGLVSVFPNLASMAARLIAAMTVLMALEPRFGLVVLAAGVTVIFITGVMRKHLKGLQKKVSEHDGKVSGFVQEVLERLLMVQAMDVSGEIERRADVLLDKRFEVQRKRKNVSLMANTGVSMMTYGAGFGALVWCSFGLLQGRISVGTLTAVTQLVSQLQTPFVGLSGVIPQYVAMLASAERLQELETIEHQPEPLTESRDALYERIQDIRGERLCFSYDRDAILKEASFVLPKGAFAVITGPSGIGKSTLLKLLMGVVRPDKGRLYLQCEGEPVSVDRTTRQLFAYVPQGNLLLSGTLRDNLMITMPDASEADIDLAVHASAMDDFLPQLPRGLDTVLGENGIGLSEGQAQRLAIGRAVLSGAPILLLDECTSALDADTEQTVLQRLRDLPGRTCIAVTHRPAAVELCDWRLAIDEGMIQASEYRK